MPPEDSTVPLPSAADTIAIFGAHWDAALLDGPKRRVATPLGLPCLRCDEPIAADDRGLLQPVIFEVDGDLDTECTFWPVHLECDLLSVVGGLAHTMGRCACVTRRPDPPWAGTKREEALAVMAYVNDLRVENDLPPL
jgi:hypothetical protein